MKLWEILRTLEERVALLREMAERARRDNRLREAGAWEGLISGLEENMQTVQGMLTNGKISEIIAPPLS